MITFVKPDGFPVDVIPVKSQMVLGSYAVSFVTDSAFEVRFTYINRAGEKERCRLYADKPLDQDLGIYGTCEVIPDHTHVEIVPVEDALSLISQTLSKISSKREEAGNE